MALISLRSTLAAIGYITYIANISWSCHCKLTTRARQCSYWICLDILQTLSSTEEVHLSSLKCFGIEMEFVTFYIEVGDQKGRIFLIFPIHAICSPRLVLDL